MRIDKLTNQLQNALADAQSIAVGNDHYNGRSSRAGAEKHTCARGGFQSLLP